MAFWIAETIWTKKLRVAVYIRVSTEEQVSNQTYLWQEEAIRKYVASRDDTLMFAWDEFRFRDKWVSWATDIEERPSLSLLMDYVRTYPKEYMPFDVVLVYKLDRFARSLLILLGILDELQTKGMSFISTTENIDTSTPFGKMNVQMIGSFAEMERTLIQERTWMWIERSIKTWKWRHDIYWYKKDASKRPKKYQPEADVVQEIFNSYVKWVSPTEIAKTLTARLIRVPWAKNIKRITKMVANRPTLWTAKTVMWILDNEVYTGKYYYNKTKRIIDVSTLWRWTRRQYKTIMLNQSERLLSPVSHEIIIPEALFLEARRIFSQNLHIWQRGSKAVTRYLLSPYLRCDYCKEHRHQSWLSHWKWSTSNGVTQYMCNKKHTWKNKGWQICTVVPISKKYLDRFVMERIREIFENPKAIASHLHGKKSRTKHQKYYTDELARIEYDLSLQERKKQKIRDLYTETDMDATERDGRLLQVENYLKILLEQQVDITKKLAWVHETQKYIDTFEKLKELISSNFDEYFKDEDKVAKLLNAIIHEIIIYSRHAVPADRVSGRKTAEWKQQAVPYHVKIVFKMPQDILTAFIKWFDDDDSPWVGWDPTKWPKKWPSIWNSPSGMMFRDKDGNDTPYSGQDVERETRMSENVTSNLQHPTIVKLHHISLDIVA